jgi:hypothetical protein
MIIILLRMCSHENPAVDAEVPAARSGATNVDEDDESNLIRAIGSHAFQIAWCTLYARRIVIDNEDVNARHAPKMHVRSPD